MHSVLYFIMVQSWQILFTSSYDFAYLNIYKGTIVEEWLKKLVNLGKEKHEPNIGKIKRYSQWIETN